MKMKIDDTNNTRWLIWCATGVLVLFFLSVTSCTIKSNAMEPAVIKAEAILKSAEVALEQEKINLIKERLAAVEQLRQITAKIEVDLFADEAGKPVEVVKAGLEQARANLYDVVLIDTAGRLAIDEALMGELKEVKDERTG